MMKLAAIFNVMMMLFILFTFLSYLSRVMKWAMNLFFEFYVLGKVRTYIIDNELIIITLVRTKLWKRWWKLHRSRHHQDPILIFGRKTRCLRGLPMLFLHTLLKQCHGNDRASSCLGLFCILIRVFFGIIKIRLMSALSLINFYTLNVNLKTNS